MKKYIWYLYAFLASIVLYLIAGFYTDEVGKNYYKEFYAKPLNGHIVFLSSGSRKKTEFRLNTQKEGDGLYLERDRVGINDTAFNLYQIAEIGDSIFKDSNNACLKLIKKNGKQIWFEMVDY